MSKKVVSAKSKTKSLGFTIAKIDLGLYRAILLCIEIVILAWIALVANNIFGARYELLTPYFSILMVLFLVLLLGVTFFTKHREMLVMCTFFLAAAIIGSAFVGHYGLLGTVECGTETNCVNTDVVYETRNIYWIRIK